MFTEYEVETILENQEIVEATKQLKRDFLTQAAPYLDISDADFFSLIIMTPNLDLAMADGKITFWEERLLTKKARKLSKGGFFFNNDPVVYAMKYLIKNYDEWIDRFYEVLAKALKATCDRQLFSYTKTKKENHEVNYSEYKRKILATPYIMIRFISEFFLESDEDIINNRHKMKESERERLEAIGAKLGLDKVEIFSMFCNTVG